MRIRVSGRFIAAFAILTLFLCLLPASTPVAVAKPMDWPADEPPPKGDNDGVVLKSGTIKSKQDGWGAWNTGIASGDRYYMGGLRGYYAMMMLRYWSFWVR